MNKANYKSLVIIDNRSYLLNNHILRPVSTQRVGEREIDYQGNPTRSVCVCTLHVRHAWSQKKLFLLTCNRHHNSKPSENSQLWEIKNEDGALKQNYTSYLLN